MCCCRGCYCCCCSHASTAAAAAAAFRPSHTQVLQVIVMDEDLISFQNKVMGVAQVPLREVREKAS